MNKRIFKPDATDRGDKVDAFLIETALMEKLVDAVGGWQDSVNSAKTLQAAFIGWMANKLTDKEFISEALMPIQALVDLQKALCQSSVVMSAYHYFNPNL